MVCGVCPDRVTYLMAKRQTFKLFPKIHLSLCLYKHFLFFKTRFAKL